MSGEKGKRGARPVPKRGVGGLCLLAFPLAIVAFLALFASPALAGKTHALKGTFGAFSKPSGIAIDQANGNVFVADGFPSNSVEIFGSGGGAPIGITVAKIEGFSFGNEPSGLAIDNSPTSPSQGALYVADVNNDAVKKFTLEGGEYKSKGTLNTTPPAPAMRKPFGVVVDAKGNVFVADFGDSSAGIPSSIVEFSPAGTEIARLDVSASLGSASALALDSAGNLYAQGFFGGVYKFEANGTGEIEAGTIPTRILDSSSSSSGLAVDQTTDTLYVADKDHVAQYSTSCVPVPTPVGARCEPELEFGFGRLGATQRVAVAPNGDIYVVDRGKGNVAIFEAAESVVPDVVTKATSAVKQSAASLNGTLSAAGGPPASCEFQYTTKSSFDLTGFTGATSAPCSTGPFTGTAANPVEAKISGLSIETAYVFRLIGTNENGPSFGAVLSFATVGAPKVKASSIAPLSLDNEGARVEGLINPNGGPNAAVETTYAVEYVSAADFDKAAPEGGYANATKVPVGGEAIGSGSEDVKVAQQLSGLASGTTYHFRIVAENEAGPTIGPDKTFTTFAEAVAGLPDGRFYEQATPVDKGGASAQGVIDYVRAARGGGGITFFSNGGVPGGEGAQQFPQYISARNADGSGWSTQGVLPPASNGSSALVRGFNEELTQAYVVQGPVPNDLQTFYQRDSATRALRPIAGEIKPFELHNSYAGESADGSKVLVEAVYGSNPPPNAVEGQNVFLWEKASGALHLAGVLNDGQTPAGGASAGSYAVGGPANYTAYEHPISSGGSRVLFTSLGSHQIYLRQNPTQPQSPLDGAGNCTEAALACTVQVSASKRTTPPLNDEKAATLWGATPDCRYAFFTSPGKLTNNATTGPADKGNDLYRYDTETEELIDLTRDPSDPNGAEVQGVLGISEDGSYVYFVANGVLASNEGADGSVATLGDCVNGEPEYAQFTKGESNLYLWHDGVITYIARQEATGSGGGGSEQKSAAWNWVRKPDIQKGEKTARVSSDGSILFFQSPQQLTAYDNEGFAEFYRYDAAAEELSCVSCNPSGAGPVGSASLQGIGVVISSGIRPAPVQTRNMSADGKRVFFETPDRLVAGDTNGVGGCPLVKNGDSGAPSCQDVYEWEAAGAGSCPLSAGARGCLSLISSGRSPEPSYFADASASGEDVFFFTLEQLVGQDQDQIVDIYDARVGGGIAAQNPLPPEPPCEAESCKGPIPPAPIAPAAGSSHFQGPKDPVPCRRGKVRKHGKCVKKKQPGHKKKQDSKRSAKGAAR